MPVGSKRLRCSPSTVLRSGGATLVDYTGKIASQLEAVLQYFRQYLQVRYEIPSEVGRSQSMLEAIRRREIWEYPLEALREAVINSLIHRDYFDTLGHISIRVYDDRLYIWNPGQLPPGMVIEDLLRRPHDSRPRSPLLARVFYYAGWIEHWGSGTIRILDLCRRQGLPDPQFQSGSSRFEVLFNKDLYSDELLHAAGLNDRQLQAVVHVKDHGRITIRHIRISRVYQRLLPRVIWSNWSAVISYRRLERPGKVPTIS